MAAQCCCRKAPGAEAAPARPPPEPPPALDVASASSAQLFRLRHLQLGLELRPEARELAGCLVLELCALRPAPRALVLDAHPALRLHSVSFRRSPAASELPCTFSFPVPGLGPPLPAFADASDAESAGCPLAFRLDPFTDYGSSLTITLPPELLAHQPFQIILRYTSTDAPAVSPARVGVRPVGGRLDSASTSSFTARSGDVKSAPCFWDTCRGARGSLAQESSPGAHGNSQMLPASSWDL